MLKHTTFTKPIFGLKKVILNPAPRSLRFYRSVYCFSGHLFRSFNHLQYLYVEANVQACLLELVLTKRCDVLQISEILPARIWDIDVLYRFFQSVETWKLYKYPHIWGVMTHLDVQTQLPHSLELYTIKSLHHSSCKAQELACTWHNLMLLLALDTRLLN